MQKLPLDLGEIDAFLSQHPDWAYEGGTIYATWVFPDDASAVRALAAIAQHALAAGHHPAVTWEYRTLAVVLSSHDAGDKVTPRDTALAPRLSQAVAAAGGKRAAA